MTMNKPHKEIKIEKFDAMRKGVALARVLEMTGKARVRQRKKKRLNRKRSEISFYKRVEQLQK